MIGAAVGAAKFVFVNAVEYSYRYDPELLKSAHTDSVPFVPGGAGRGGARGGRARERCWVHGIGRPQTVSVRAAGTFCHTSVHAVPVVLVNFIQTSVGSLRAPVYLTATSTAGSATTGTRPLGDSPDAPGATVAVPDPVGGCSGCSCSHAPAHSW